MQLYLCEKPSQARDIARVLDARNRSDGYLHNATVTITWCFGHLLSMAAPEDYDPTLKHWRTEQLPFIPPAWRLVIRPEVRKQFRIIEKLLKQADAVVIATDADREGETIAREILEQCRWRGPVQRMTPVSTRRLLRCDPVTVRIRCIRLDWRAPAPTGWSAST